MPTKSKKLQRSPVIISIIALSFFVGRHSHDIFPTSINQSPTTSGLHLCTHVTDGDTIKVIFNGQTERVRILDIDAPEVRRGSKLQEQARKARVSEDTMLERGLDAKRMVESMVLGKEVQLEFRDNSGQIKRDSFGRLLCDVMVDGTNVAERLLELGLVEVYGE